ncbi:hypothetical protein [Methylobacterium persicinum]|uniref:Porin n=1 Tax=Methylobacterium persicinum TaxID=374426 RepID=A0ABU0HIC6_9HYPH|nr:hypothetical protein [Methylobacterium persicinum]MDQ0442081.1 hypothetical protein [Methylobacterium persicinum]GJE38820.1 hypothetical protein KHHGKMAE_2895 [Methylobacterium persicinum]
MRRLVPIALVLLLPGVATATEREAQRQICAKDLPEGAHLSALPACAETPPRKADGHGFRDLGNGVSVRIGGRVGAEYGVSR